MFPSPAGIDYALFENGQDCKPVPLRLWGIDDNGALLYSYLGNLPISGRFDANTGRITFAHGRHPGDQIFISTYDGYILTGSNNSICGLAGTGNIWVLSDVLVKPGDAAPVADVNAKVLTLEVGGWYANDPQGIIF